MNRVGLKDYLLNHADDNDLLDCAKAWDAANKYGQFDTYKSVEEAAEVKRDSFAYDQGARFNVKILTDGYNCGNGRFCADLDDAHGFCQQFADDIAGLGESLDDMCEDRCEVASAAQAVEVADRGQVNKRHDDSEIGE